MCVYIHTYVHMYIFSEPNINKFQIHADPFSNLLLSLDLHDHFQKLKLMSFASYTE